MPIDYNPVWDSTAGRDGTYGFDSTDENDSTAPGGELLTYLIGDPMTIADLSRLRNRLFTMKVEVDDTTEYDTTVVVDFDIENSVVSGEEFELGAAIISKLTIKLRTNDVIAPNAKIVPYLAMVIDGERVTAWFPMGEFYVDSREQKNAVWTFTCFDKLVWAEEQYISTLTYPATMQDVWDEICTSLGYVDDANVVIDATYEFQAGPAGFSKRQVMGYIAGANAASVIVGKDGLITFRRYSAAGTPVIDLETSDYSNLHKINPTKTYTRIVATYDTEEELTYEAGTGDDDHTLFIENPFITQAMVDDLLTTLNGFTYVPVTIEARGYPQLAAGNVIGFESTEQTVILHHTFGYKGGLRMSIDAPSRSEQQSEFQVDGTLTGAIKKLNRDAVKLGKSYFGATLTRTDGLTIEREDHASKVILNSDKMAFQADGIDKLYFDPVSGKYKFVGDVEIQGGTIADEITGGVITGATLQSSAPGSGISRIAIEKDGYGPLGENGAIVTYNASGQLDGLVAYSDDNDIWSGPSVHLYREGVVTLSIFGDPFGGDATIEFFGEIGKDSSTITAKGNWEFDDTIRSNNIIPQDNSSDFNIGFSSIGSWWVKMTGKWESPAGALLLVDDLRPKTISGDGEPIIIGNTTYETKADGNWRFKNIMNWDSSTDLVIGQSGEITRFASGSFVQFPSYIRATEIRPYSLDSSDLIVGTTSCEVTARGDWIFTDINPTASAALNIGNTSWSTHAKGDWFFTDIIPDSTSLNVGSTSFSTHAKGSWMFTDIVPDGTSLDIGSTSFSTNAKGDWIFSETVKVSSIIGDTIVDLNVQAGSGQNLILQPGSGMDVDCLGTWDFTSITAMKFDTSPTASSGSGGAPPAQVSGYISIVLNGSTHRIPYYN